MACFKRFDIIRSVGERWRLRVSILPVLAVFICGIVGTRPVVYIDLTAVFLASVIALDPLGLVKTALSPGTRAGLTIGCILILICLQISQMDLYFRVWGVSFGVGLATTCLLCNGRWMASYRVRQSVSVDKTLAYLAHGGDLPGAKEWDNYGCRESRALLHQSVRVEIGEWELNRSYKAVYLLAYLHGMRGADIQIRKLEKKIKKLEDERNLDMEIFQEMQEKNLEIESLREELEHERRKNLSLQTVKEKPVDRDSAIVEYIEEGHSYREASEKFGLSKARISGIVKEKGG